MGLGLGLGLKVRVRLRALKPRPTLCREKRRTEEASLVCGLGLEVMKRLGVRGGVRIGVGVTLPSGTIR